MHTPFPKHVQPNFFPPLDSLVQIAKRKSTDHFSPMVLCFFLLRCWACKLGQLRPTATKILFFMRDQPDLFQVSEITVAYYPKKGYAPQIESSEDAYDTFISYWDIGTLEYEERMVVLFLNRCNRVLGAHTHSIGGINGTVGDPRQIFAIALKANAVGIILAHNHPSGALTPSDHDIKLTRKFQKAGEFLDIRLLDHLIITPQSHYSFADEGML